MVVEDCGSSKQEMLCIFLSTGKLLWRFVLAMVVCITRLLARLQDTEITEPRSALNQRSARIYQAGIVKDSSSFNYHERFCFEPKADLFLALY